MTETATDRHLQMLDRLAEIGMACAERIHTHPTKNYPHDLDTVSRVVRRCILLYHLLETNQLPRPRQAADPKPEATRTPSAPAASGRTRLDPIDRLDDVSGPFQHVVASIVRDIQTALAGIDFPPGQQAFVQDIIHRQIPLPTRHEADTADLK